MDFEEACRWSREGWLWAPQEKLETFVLRKESFLHVEFPLRKEISSSLFDIQSSKICVIEDNSSLWPWQGALLWEYEMHGVKYPVIQLRSSLPGLWKRFYKQDEMIEHELVHAVRYAYKEPFFEEVLAYQTSSKKWRRFVGPLFMYPWEATFLLIASLGSFLLSIIYDSFLGVGGLLALFGFFFLRLLVVQGLFSLCKRKLEQVGCSSEYSLAVILRLSDKEIVRTALSSLRNIRKYFRKTSGQVTRIGILMHLYFKES